MLACSVRVAFVQQATAGYVLATGMQCCFNVFQ